MCSRPVELYLDPPLCCGHVLHRACVDEAWARYGKCPICKLEVSTPYGLEVGAEDVGDISTVQWLTGLLLAMETECNVVRNKIRLEGVHNHAFCDHFKTPCLSDSLEHRAPTGTQEPTTWNIEPEPSRQSEGRRIGDIDEQMMAEIVERTILRIRENQEENQRRLNAVEGVEGEDEEVVIINID